MSKRYRDIACAAALVALSLTAVAPGAAEAAEPLRIGLARQPSSALMVVAIERGYFAAEGLDVAIETFPSGKRALTEGLFAARVDVATTADVPVVFASLDRGDFRILASTYTSDDVNRIVARRDHAIAAPADLRGKRVATQRASAVHFFLHLFRLDQGLAATDLEIGYLKAEELPGALNRGEIDAFSMREPYVGEAVAVLGDNAVVFSAPGLYVQADLFVASDSVVASRRLDVEKALRALSRAEAFVREQPEQAAVLLARHLGSDETEVAKVLAAARVRLELPQDLLPRLEEMARWAKESGLVEASEMPNYLNLLHLDGLRAVRPEAVTVID